MSEGIYSYIFEVSKQLLLAAKWHKWTDLFVGFFSKPRCNKRYCMTYCLMTRCWRSAASLWLAVFKYVISWHWLKWYMDYNKQEMWLFDVYLHDVFGEALTSGARNPRGHVIWRPTISYTWTQCELGDFVIHRTPPSWADPHCDALIFTP